jgi:hypothetical protein
VGVTEIRNSLKYKNKIASIDNINCIINGIFHGIECWEHGRKHQYFEKKLMLAWY